jgi:hypothetical protein
MLVENDMYEPIIKSFKSQNFVAWKQFPITHPLVKDRYRRVDVVAFRWDSDVLLNATAVEAKPGSEPATPLEAIQQASTYQLLFPSVYVAARTKQGELSFSEGILRALGLGYIEVTDGNAVFVFPPQENARAYENLFLETIRPTGVVALLTRHIQRQQNYAADSPNWVLKSGCAYTMPIDQVQLQFSVDEKSGNVLFGCWSEVKQVCDRLAKKVDPDKLADLLSRVPSNFKRCYQVQQVESQFQDKRSIGEPFTFDDGREGVSAAMDTLRGWCSEPKRSGIIALWYKLWDRSHFVSRPEAESRLDELLNEVVAIRQYLNELL